MRVVVPKNYSFKRIKHVVNARILKKWGTAATKKAIWDAEFSSGQWDYLDSTGGDPIYPYLEKYSNHGTILDLGCGSSNTGNELDVSKYRSYTGVDISESAIRRALARCIKNRRQSKNEYVCEDISAYVPQMRYDIILFRESIFYIPRYQIRQVVNRYSHFLKESGVFVVRMCDRNKYRSIVSLVERHYNVLAKSSLPDPDIILVFR